MTDVRIVCIFCKGGDTEKDHICPEGRRNSRALKGGCMSDAHIGTCASCRSFLMEIFERQFDPKIRRKPVQMPQSQGRYVEPRLRLRVEGG